MSIADAKQDLYAYLCSEESEGIPHEDISDFVVKVFKGEPAPGVKPRSSALTVFTEGLTATEYLFRVRIYVDPTLDALAMQDKLDAALEAVGNLLDESTVYGRVDWQHGYDQQIDMLVAQTVLEVGREDFGYSQR